ncbi:fibronectin type III domain-containing protein, partial [Arthrobacter sp. zg-Y1110]
FENDWLGWTRTNTSISGVSTSYKHSGAKSAYAYYGMSQVVTVPAESPVLTFWSRVTAPGVSVNGANMSTAGTAAAAENGFTQYSADLSAYAGKTVSVTFNTGGNELDDVAFEGPMAPSAPQSVTALSKSGTATVSWKSPVFTGGGIPVSSYTAVAMAGGVQVASVKVAGDQLAAVFTGLEAGTEYSFKVRATNEAGTSADSAAFGPVAFNTGAFTNPGFENDWLGWTRTNTSISGISTSKHSGAKSAYAYYGMSQVVTVPAESPVLTFWSRVTAPGVSVNGANMSTAGTAATAENGFTQYSADLSAYAGKTVSVTFNTSGNELDDVAFEGPMAPSAPQSVTALSKSGTATVSWKSPVFTGGGIPVSSYTATAWTGGVQVASVKVAGDQLAAVFTGLEAGTEYSFKVRATNEAGTSPDSAAFGPVAFNTGAFTNPGFENGTLGWSLSTSSSRATTGYKHSGTASLEPGYANHWVSQTVTVPEATPVLTLWGRSSAPVVRVGTTQVPAVLTQAAVENGFNQYSADLSAYAGKTVTVGLASNYYIDDVAFEKPMAPSAPQSVTALSKSGTATASWTAPVFTGGGIPISSYTATAWTGGVQVASVKVAGDQLAAVFTGLEAGTEYSFKVRATNEAGTSPDSAAFGPVAFNTGAFTNPGFENGTLGWSLSTSASRATTGYKHSGTASLEPGYSNYWVSQTVTVPEATPVLTLWGRSSAPVVRVGTTQVPAVLTAAAVENGFNQYSADLSAYAGKTVTVGLASNYYIDDVAFEKPMAPSAPQSVTALSKSGTATASWTAPVFTGGGIPISSYTATAWTGGVQVASVKVAGDQLAAVFTGLEAGTGYSFKVRATNEAGTSPDSAAFGPVAFNTGAFTNPGFENGTLGWSLSTSASRATTGYKHSGTASLESGYSNYWVSQTVTVPEEAPVLTLWGRSAVPVVRVGTTQIPAVLTAAAVENGFNQYSADLSAYAGKTVTVGLASNWYIDDVAFE